MTKQRRDYYHYLKSGHWKQLRRQAFERDGFKCTVCGRNNRLVGHHKRYRANLWLCTVKDIVTLCKIHHKEVHARLAEERKNKPKFMSPIAYVIFQFSAD